MIRKTFRIACVVLAASVVVVASAAVSPGTAESSGAGPDCSGWLTDAFWKAAAAEDVESCLAAGAKLDTRGQTPLHKAASKGKAATVNALLAAGANIEARDGWDETPLHGAASEGNTDTLNALLAAGAKIEARTRWRKTHLYRRALKGDTVAQDLARILKHVKRDKTPLYNAVLQGKWATAKALLTAGAKIEALDIEARDKRGMTRLHRAVANRNATAITVLLDAGADGAARTPDGLTPFDLLRMGATHRRWLETDAWKRLRDARSR